MKKALNIIDIVFLFILILSTLAFSCTQIVGSLVLNYTFALAATYSSAILLVSGVILWLVAKVLYKLL